MIKKTLYFGNPTYLSLTDGQLVVKMPEVEKSNLNEKFKQETRRTIPIEDIGVVVIDHRQITITSGVLEALLENECAVITCDSHRMPVGLMLPLAGNTLQSERFNKQIDASEPLKKQLWAQTVQQKLRNQAASLSLNNEGAETGCMLKWADSVRSGDPDNLEARGAAYYWKNLFSTLPGFVRDRDGLPPNALLNYGYAILRSVIARALVGSGLLPTLGIHHHNRYNAYCLADDIMEPYRPYVDLEVCRLMHDLPPEQWQQLTLETKARLLAVPAMDVMINDKRSPLMIAAGITTASLFKCYNGEIRKIVYPELTPF